MSAPDPHESTAQERAIARPGAVDPGVADGVPRWVRIAHQGLRSGLALRAGLSLAGALVLLAGGIVMAGHGIVDHTFPPFVAGTAHTVITSYSGPWLAGAIGVGAVAGLLLVVTVTDLWRRRLIGPDLRTSATPQAG